MIRCIIIQSDNAPALLPAFLRAFYLIHILPADRTDLFQCINHPIYCRYPDLFIRPGCFIKISLQLEQSFSRIISISIRLCFVMRHPFSFSFLQSALFCSRCTSSQSLMKYLSLHNRLSLLHFQICLIDLPVIRHFCTVAFNVTFATTPSISFKAFVTAFTQCSQCIPSIVSVFCRSPDRQGTSFSLFLNS